jgi:hypothetical protein
MAKGWKIISTTERLGGGPPMKEYFLVAIEDRHGAIEALRIRKNLLNATIVVDGEARPELFDWLDVQPGQILSVVAVS